MARRPMPLGTWGKIRTYGRVDNEWIPKASIATARNPGSWRAMTNYRGYDGRTRQVEKTGPTETKAVRRLKDELADRSGKRVKLTSAARLADGAKIYLEWVKLNRAATTYDRYKGRVDNHVLLALGQLLYREASVSVLKTYFLELQRQGMPAWTQRGIRTVLSGIMAVGVEEGVIDHNPVRDLPDITGGTVRAAKAMKQVSLTTFFARVDGDTIARRQDLPDFLRFTFGTANRFGESLGARWCDLNLSDEPIVAEERDDEVELPPHSLWINGNIVYVNGVGLVRHPLKSKKSNRIVILPDFLYTMLLVRKPLGVPDTAPIFPNRIGTWRHPSNVGTSIRRMRTRIGFPEFRTHAGRKTVGTVLDKAGHSAREIADQLGHAKPSMTQDVYMGRGWLNPEVAQALDGLFKP